jgi:F420-0:gamma-glutamyl ligase
MILTMRNNTIMPSAGIDESNIKDSYVLHPSDPYKSAEEIWNYLRIKFNIKDLGVIITDSNITMMRKGVSGFALS